MRSKSLCLQHHRSSNLTRLVTNTGMLEGTPRTATARAFESSLILSITRENMMNVLDMCPDLKESMVRTNRDGPWRHRATDEGLRSCNLSIRTRETR